MRLWLRLALLMALVALVPLGLAMGRAIQVSVRSAQRSAQVVIERDAHLVASVLGNVVAGEARALQGWLALQPDLDRRPASQQEALLQAIRVARPDLGVLVLVDAEGVLVVPPAFGTLGGDASAEAQGAAAAALLLKLPISEVRPELVGDGVEGDPEGRQGHPGWALGPPYARTEGGRVVAPLVIAGPWTSGMVLGAEIDVERAFEDVLGGAPGPERSAAVLTRDARIAWSTRDANLDAARLKMLLGTHAGFADDVLGVYGGVAPIAGTDWTVVITEPASVSERSADLLRRQALSVMGVSMVLALLFGVVVARGVSEPVGSLRDAANAVADGDYTRRVAVDGTDEVGELATAFNHMAARLARNRDEIQAQQSKIQAFNQELQERVEARTAELRAAQSQLVASGKLAAVAEISAGLAHELNNPLTGVLGLTQLLRARLPAEPLLGSLEREAERCREVVGTMLRLSAEEVDRDPSDVIDLRVCVGDALGLMHGPYRQRGIALTYKPSVEPVLARVHPAACVRVLVQLLQSMRAGLPDGAAVELRLQGRGGQAATILLEADRELAAGATRDDFLAGGLGGWVARREVDDWGGALAELESGRGWAVTLPRGEGRADA